MHTITDYERGLLVSWSSFQDLPLVIKAIFDKIADTPETIAVNVETEPPSLSDILEKVEKHRGRITNALRGSEIRSLEDLLNVSAEEFLSFPNVGKDSLLHLEHALSAFGLHILPF